MFEGVLARSWGEARPKGAILSVLKEVGGFGGVVSVVWRSLVGWGRPGVLLGAPMHPMSSGIAADVGSVALALRRGRLWSRSSIGPTGPQLMYAHASVSGASALNVFVTPDFTDRFVAESSHY